MSFSSRRSAREERRAANLFMCNERNAPHERIGRERGRIRNEPQCSFSQDYASQDSVPEVGSDVASYIRDLSARSLLISKSYSPGGWTRCARRGGAREHWALFKDPSGSSVAPLWNCLSCGSSEHNESGNESVSQSGRGKNNNKKKEKKRD